MNSPFANLFEAMLPRLQSEVPELAWIDFDLGQLEAFDGDRPPVSFPCLLIDFNDTQFDQMQGYQDGNVNIRMRLAFDEYQSTNAETPDYVRTQALQYFEIEHKIHLAMQGWRAGGILTNAMIRQGSQSEKREEDNLRVRAIDYSATFSDASVTS